MVVGYHISEDCAASIFYISQPYKTAGKFMVLYLLIFKSFERRWEDKIS
jgi:hypothetical protein